MRSPQPFVQIAALALGGRVAADFGTLEAGKIADLVVLNADPLIDIRNTLAIDSRGCDETAARGLDPPQRPQAT